MLPKSVTRGLVTKATMQKGHRETEAETGVRWPPAQGHLEPPEAGRGRKDPLLAPLDLRPHETNL